MRYSIKMGSDGMIYMSSFIKIDSGNRKSIREDSHAWHGDLVNLLIYFLNEERRLKREIHKPFLE
jgi:hypothetical protein